MKEQLGHSTIRVTMDVYGHLFPAERERLADALDAAHREAAAQRLHNGAERVASLIGGM